LAALRVNKGAGLQMEWHWSILLFAGIAVVWNGRLWKAIFQAQAATSRKAKRRLTFHLSALVLLGVGAFLYPLAFVESGYRHGIFKGVLTATSFLSVLGWILYTFAKGFAAADAIELQRQANALEQIAPAALRPSSS
jgi:hypothetical protein